MILNYYFLCYCDFDIFKTNQGDLIIYEFENKKFITFIISGSSFVVANIITIKGIYDR